MPAGMQINVVSHLDDHGQHTGAVGVWYVKWSCRISIGFFSSFLFLISFSVNPPIPSTID